MRLTFLFALALFSNLALADIQIHISAPAQQANVSSPVTVQFNVTGIEAQELAKQGHLHLIIDKPLPQQGETIPADANHLHLSATQTEVELKLSPGKHSLQLLLGNHHHTPHKDNIHSEVLVINVSE